MFYTTSFKYERFVIRVDGYLSTFQQGLELTLWVKMVVKVKDAQNGRYSSWLRICFDDVSLFWIRANAS